MWSEEKRILESKIIYMTLIKFKSILYFKIANILAKIDNNIEKMLKY